MIFMRFSTHSRWRFCIGDALSLEIVSSLKQFAKVLEEVALLHPNKLYESPLARFMRFNTTIVKNVPDRHIRSFEVSTDEDCPMASERVLLSTHKRYPVALDALLDAFYPSTKSVCRCEPIILYLSPFIAGGVGRARTKFFPEEDIGDVVERKFFLKGLTVELRIEAAVGIGSDIADCRNTVFHEEIEKLREWVC